MVGRSRLRGVGPYPRRATDRVATVAFDSLPADTSPGNCFVVSCLTKGHGRLGMRVTRNWLDLLVNGATGPARWHLT